MEENTQRDHGSKAQEWGNKEMTKKGENDQLALGATWAPLQVGGVTSPISPLNFDIIFFYFLY